MSHRQPLLTDEHWPFYQHLKAGGTLHREDKMNGISQDITLHTLDHVPEKIYYYGFRDLSIIPLE